MTSHPLRLLHSPPRLQSFNPPILQSSNPPSLQASKAAKPCQPPCHLNHPKHLPHLPKTGPNGGGGGGRGGFRGGLRGNTLGLAVARTPPWPAWVPEPYWGKPQEASLGPRALLGEASGGQPRSQSLMGRSIRRPAQSLIGESFSRPPWIPEPYGGKRQAATLDPRAKWGEASGGHPGSQSLIGESISWPPRQS